MFEFENIQNMKFDIAAKSIFNFSEPTNTQQREREEEICICLSFKIQCIDESFEQKRTVHNTINGDSVLFTYFLQIVFRSQRRI